MAEVEEQIEQIPFARREAVDYAANLETVRINRWRMVRIFKRKIGSLDGGAQYLDSDEMDPAWIYVINNITAWEDDNKPDTYEIGFVSQHTFHRLLTKITSQDLESAEYVGQLILTEGEKIRVGGRGCTSGDTLYLYASGYKIRR